MEGIAASEAPDRDLMKQLMGEEPLSDDECPSP